MASLLDGVLPYLYSQGDRAKRYAKSLLDDPMGSLAQTAGGLVDAAHEQQALQAQAFGNPQRPFQVTDKQALGKAIDGTMQGVMGFAPAGITVYHGSPHVFDKFDSSKIGTGEGAQAYGHGLYLAESPGVAQGYKDALANPSSPLNDVAKHWRQNGGESAYRAFAKDAGLDDRTIAEVVAAIKGNGALYKVDLPDSAVAKMLDYDATIGGQNVPLDLFTSAQKRALESMPSRFGPLEIPQELAADILKKKQGSQAYALLRDQYGAEKASQMMRDAGITGIRYLDGGSRSNGAGTSNFVVFPGQESLLQILERNGQPLR